jgi:hypothetical protein
VNSSTSSSRWLTYFFASLSVGLVIIIGASEWLVRTKVEPIDAFQAHVRHLVNTVSPNIVLGDSIAAHGFLGRKEFENFSYPGDNPAQLLVKAQLWVRKGDARRAIVEASPTLLRRQETDAAEYTGLFARHNVDFLRILSPRHRQRLIQYWRIMVTEGEFVSAFEYFKYGGLRWTEEDSFPSANMNEQEKISRDQIAVQAIPENQAFRKNQVQFERLLNYLAENQVKVCIVEWPVHPLMRSLVDDYPLYMKRRAIFADLARNHGFVYRSYWDMRFDDVRSAYSDPMHLRTGAAREFSRAVVEDCFPSIRQ